MARKDNEFFDYTEHDDLSKRLRTMAKRMRDEGNMPRSHRLQIMAQLHEREAMIINGDEIV